MADDRSHGSSDDVERSETLPSVPNVESTPGRRRLLAGLGTTASLLASGCLGLLSGRSETGPRPGDPTPVPGTDTSRETSTVAPRDLEQYAVEFSEQGATIDVPGNEALLYAGLDEGWDLPYVCERGVCGECTARVDGDGTELVEHDGNEYLDEDQVEEGFVLTCVGYPRADFSIRTGAVEEADEV
jgi:ferredoxin